MQDNIPSPPAAATPTWTQGFHVNNTAPTTDSWVSFGSYIVPAGSKQVTAAVASVGGSSYSTYTQALYDGVQKAYCSAASNYAGSIGEAIFDANSGNKTLDFQKRNDAGFSNGRSSGKSFYST